MITLLLIASALSQTCASSFWQYSLDLCKTEDACLSAFTFGEHHGGLSHFRVMLEVFMERNGITKPEACESEALWLQVMSLHRMCGVNEEYDSDRGCVCKANKICLEKDPEEFGVSTAIKFIFLGLCLFFFSYYGPRSIRLQQRAVRSN